MGQIPVWTDLRAFGEAGCTVRTNFPILAEFGLDSTNPNFGDFRSSLFWYKGGSCLPWVCLSHRFASGFSIGRYWVVSLTTSCTTLCQVGF